MTLYHITVMMMAIIGCIGLAELTILALIFSNMQRMLMQIKLILSAR